jgi:hypothetical protein
MKRSALVVGALAALGISASAFAQPEWVNGQGEASGHWRAAEYRVANGGLVRVDRVAAASDPVSARPALSWRELASESENGASVWDRAQPRYRIDGGRLALQNPAPATPRERLTMNDVERAYRDFATG